MSTLNKNLEKERDAVNARIDNLFEREGSVNREFPDKPSIHDLIYDELRNLNGAMASFITGNEIYLQAIVDNTGTTASNLKDVKHRLKEIIHLSGNVRDNTAVMSEHLETSNQQLDEINTNCYDTVKGIDSVDEKLGETNGLFTDVRNYQVIDSNNENDLKFTDKEKQVIYLALSTFVKHATVGNTLLESNDNYKVLLEKIKGN
tara:strand:- start:554 stop:1165 length:612 start_codon:yes stop_codon:yes gene_type:complete